MPCIALQRYALALQRFASAHPSYALLCPCRAGSTPIFLALAFGFLPIFFE
jgi:hypothetical protein